jgi:hypothetical protein
MSATKTVKNAIKKAPTDWRVTTVIYGLVILVVMIAVCITFSPGTAVAIDAQERHCRRVRCWGDPGQRPTFIDAVAKGIAAAR